MRLLITIFITLFFYLGAFCIVVEADVQNYNFHLQALYFMVIYVKKLLYRPVRLSFKDTAVADKEKKKS